MSDRSTFFIGELADRSGLTRDAIRYYEDVGVLPEAERSDGGYRLYGPEDADRLAFVGRAQALGLTLEEIAEVLDLVDEGREPCVHVRLRLEQRLRETRTRIAELRALEGRLEEGLARARRAGNGGPGSCRCRIIDGVAGGADAAREGGRGS